MRPNVFLRGWNLAPGLIYITFIRSTASVSHNQDDSFIIKIFFLEIPYSCLKIEDYPTNLQKKWVPFMTNDKIPVFFLKINKWRNTHTAMILS